MAELRSAVVAGSKGFVDAVQGHLKMRFGAAPQVARDPAEALRACSDSPGLLVLEYAGAPWLEAVKNLRGACGDAALSIVAAVPLAQAADVQPLQRAGVDEVVSWQGRVDPVIWAVERVVGRQSAQDRAAPLPVEPAPGEAEKETGFELRELPGAAPGSPTAPPVLPSLARGTAPSAVLAAPWPNAVPAAVAAEALLLSALAGNRTGDPVQLAAAERVVATASDLERAALAGGETSVDPVVLRAAAALRLRLDMALSTVPTAAAGVDQAAAQQLLAEVDGVLEQLKALAASAPAGVAPVLEPMRLAVVDAGVKLAGVVSGLVPTGTADAPAAAAAKAPAARVLSNDREDIAEKRRPVALWIVLGVALAIAAVYHGRSMVRRPEVQRASIPGAPANTVGMVRGGVPMFSALPGKAIDAAELERFKASEKAKGNVVKEVAPGTFMVLPDSAPSRGGP